MEEGIIQLAYFELNAMRLFPNNGQTVARANRA